MAPFKQSTAGQQLDTSADESGDLGHGLVARADQEVERALSTRFHLPSPHQASNRVACNTETSAARGTNGEHQQVCISFPPRFIQARRMATLHPLQEWEGHVVEIRDDDIVAMLTDITAGHEHESTEAIIPLSELSDRHRGRMVIGSIFRWVIGMERSSEGTVTRVSRIVFRDLPRMTQDDYRKGREWARSVMAAWTS